ncbi:hypothetical protein J6590_040505 [Homalodisca vitripennis]|nr:hypothetical protein J6590_040505 [Homalodisca vitripennis]
MKRRVPFRLVYTFQLNLVIPSDTAKTVVSLKSGQPFGCPELHITNRKCQDSGVQGQGWLIGSLLQEMTVGISRVSLRTKASPPPAYFDFIDWFRAGFPFLRGDTSETNALHFSSWISTGAEYPFAPEVAQRSF